jgi:tetratricopeptide (TPR) repeat protein
VKTPRIAGGLLLVGFALCARGARAQHDAIRLEDRAAAPSRGPAHPVGGPYANALRLARMLDDDRLVATLLASHAISPGATPSDVVDAADAFEAVGEPEQAVRLLQERIRRFADDPSLRARLAELLDRMGDARAAADAWRELEKSRPIAAMPTSQALAYARALGRVGQHEDAYRVLRAARPTASEDEREFWEDLAALAWNLDDSAEALRAYRVVWKKRYRVAGAGQRLIALALEAGVDDEAIAVGLEDYGATGDAESLLAAAELQSRAGNFGAANKTLALGQSNLHAFARNEEYWLLRAETYGALGEGKAATDSYRAALALDPWSVAAQSALLWDAIDRNDDEGLRRYVAAWRSNAAAHPELWSAYAVALDHLGQTSQAIAYYEKELRADRSDPLVEMELADALKRVGAGALALHFQRLSAARLRGVAAAALHGERTTEKEQRLVEFEATTARDLGGAEMGERWFRAIHGMRSADAADADAFRIDWYLSGDRLDSARRDVLRMPVDRRQKARWRGYRLALAIADDDADTIHQILANPAGVDSEQHVDAVLAMERDDLAGPALEQALAQGAASEHPEYADKLAEIRFRHAPTWSLGGNYEYVTGLDVFGPDLTAAYDVGVSRLYVKGSVRRFGVRNGSVAFAAPFEEAAANAVIRVPSSRAVTEVSVGGSSQQMHDRIRVTVVPRAALLDERQWTPSIATTVRIVGDDRIEDTGLLRMAAVCSQADVGARADLGQYLYTSVDLHGREDHSRQFHFVGAELGEEAEAGYKLRLHGPEWDVAVQGIAHQRSNVDKLPSDIAVFVPRGADLSLYLPPSFQLVSIVTHLTRGDFSERYRADESAFPRYDCEAAAGMLFPDRDGAVHVQCSVSVRLSLGGYLSAIAFYNRGIAGIGSQTSAEAALSYSQTF